MRGASSAQHFYATWQHSAIGAFRMPTAAPLARDLSRMDFATTIGRAHSRCGLLAHGWSRSRILVSYMPLVHQRRPYPRLRRTLSQRAVPQRVVMVNYRSLPDKYANPLHNTAQKCDVVHLRRFGPARAPRRRVLAPRGVLLTVMLRVHRTNNNIFLTQK